MEYTHTHMQDYTARMLYNQTNNNVQEIVPEDIITEENGPCANLPEIVHIFAKRDLIGYEACI